MNGREGNIMIGGEDWLARSEFDFSAPIDRLSRAVKTCKLHCLLAGIYFALFEHTVSTYSMTGLKLY
jgi:hypothetical protein